jgi:predicted Fe-S protein YdhL (DUF1289 family)
MPDPPGENPAFGTAPVSPCLGICLMDPRTRMCRGCLRTIEEIAGWHAASPSEKRAMLERLAARRSAAEGMA